MVAIFPTRRYRFLLKAGVWVLCAVVAFLLGGSWLYELVSGSGDAIDKMERVFGYGAIIAFLTWVYRQVTRMGELYITKHELQVLQPGYRVRVPLDQIESVIVRNETRVPTTHGIQLRVPRTVLVITLKNGKTESFVISIFAPEDGVWIRKWLEGAAHDPQQARRELSLRSSANRSGGWMGVALSFVVLSCVVPGVQALDSVPDCADISSLGLSEEPLGGSLRRCR